MAFDTDGKGRKRMDSNAEMKKRYAPDIKSTTDITTRSKPADSTGSIGEGVRNAQRAQPCKSSTPSAVLNPKLAPAFDEPPTESRPVN